MPVNLEYYWAEDASRIPASGDDETLITKALGILQENGVHLLFLFLDSRPDKEKALAKRIKKGLVDFLSQGEINLLPVGKNYEDKPTLYHELRQLSKDKERVFFSQHLLEQLLTYARYYAKAL